jgi:hypothetical protein
LAKFPGELSISNIDSDNELSSPAQKNIGETTSGRTRIETFLSFNNYTCK